MDLINRQDAIDALHNHFTDGFDEDRWWNSTHVLAVLKDVSSAEPVIRCKDCKWCREYYENEPYWVCMNWDGGTDADGFCHEAERRTDG